MHIHAAREDAKVAAALAVAIAARRAVVALAVAVAVPQPPRCLSDIVRTRFPESNTRTRARESTSQSNHYRPAHTPCRDKTI